MILDSSTRVAVRAVIEATPGARSADQVAEQTERLEMAGFATVERCGAYRVFCRPDGTAIAVCDDGDVVIDGYPSPSIRAAIASYALHEAGFAGPVIDAVVCAL